MAFMIACILFCSCAIPVSTANAGIRYSLTTIQTSIDVDSWDILAGAIKEDEGLSSSNGIPNEQRRVGTDAMDKLNKGGGIELLHNFPIPKEGETNPTFDDDNVFAASKISPLQFGLTSRSGATKNINRATTVVNCLVPELNDAYHFMNSNASDTDSIEKYKSNMEDLLKLAENGGNAGSGTYTGKVADKTMSASDYVCLKNKAGETRWFAWRIPKGYNQSVLTSEGQKTSEIKALTANPDDNQYVTWTMLAYEAFCNYCTSEKYALNSSNVYTTTPGVLEKSIVEFMNSVTGFISSALGLWSLDELVFNSGTRGGSSYIGGIFPASWESNMYAFFYIVLMIAVAFLFLNILINILHKAESTANPFVRANSMDQCKNILLSVFAIALLPIIFKILISLSSSLTGVFAAAMGTEDTVSQRFTKLSEQGTTFGGVLIQILYLGAIIYFNFLYAVRALVIVGLVIMSPFFVMLYSFNERGKQITKLWAMEFLANLFIQPIQAIFLCFVATLPPSSRTMENLILVYSLIPFTDLMRGLIFGQSGSFMHQSAMNGKEATKQLGKIGANMIGRQVVSGAKAVGSAITGNAAGAAEAAGEGLAAGPMAAASACSVGASTAGGQNAGAATPSGEASSSPSGGGGLDDDDGYHTPSENVENMEANQSMGSAPDMPLTRTGGDRFKSGLAGAASVFGGAAGMATGMGLTGFGSAMKDLGMDGVGTPIMKASQGLTNASTGLAASGIGGFVGAFKKDPVDSPVDTSPVTPAPSGLDGQAGNDGYVERKFNPESSGSEYVASEYQQSNGPHVVDKPTYTPQHFTSDVIREAENDPTSLGNGTNASHPN